MNKLFPLSVAAVFFIFSHSASAQESIEGSSISLLNVYTGYAVTAYSSNAGDYAYAYPSYAYTNDQRRQNFLIYYTTYNGKPVVQFKSDEGSRLCLRPAGYNIVINTCDTFAGNNWELISTSTGALQIKNVQTQTCLLASKPDATYANLSLTACAPSGGTAHADALWILGAPRGDAAVIY